MIRGSKVTANIVEIFSSIQGEGPYVGLRQVFVRFVGCNLACAYCDTGHAAAPSFRLYDSSSGSGFSLHPNPAGAEEVAGLISKLNSPRHHSVSLTGGEPLLHTDFIKELHQALRPSGLKFYLETNGTMPRELAAVLPVVDIISMDVKLPSTAGIEARWTEHAEFLALGAGREIFVKAVISAATQVEEVVETCRMIAGVDRKIPLIIQPVSSDNPEQRPSVSHILRLQDAALPHVDEVRVIPQTHKFLGLL